MRPNYYVICASRLVGRVRLRTERYASYVAPLAAFARGTAVGYLTGKGLTKAVILLLVPTPVVTTNAETIDLAGSKTITGQAAVIRNELAEIIISAPELATYGTAYGRTKGTVFRAGAAVAVVALHRLAELVSDLADHTT